MERHLKHFFILCVVLSIPIGFFIPPDHMTVWWHKIPSLDAWMGVLGALFLLGITKGIAWFAAKKEDFYD